MSLAQDTDIYILKKTLCVLHWEPPAVAEGVVEIWYQQLVLGPGALRMAFTDTYG